jgi:hypothetical protein
LIMLLFIFYFLGASMPFPASTRPSLWRRSNSVRPTSERRLDDELTWVAFKKTAGNEIPTLH